MVGREGDVVLRMEIPSGDFEGEGEEEEGVEDGEDGAAVGNGEGAVLSIGTSCIVSDDQR